MKPVPDHAVNRLRAWRKDEGAWGEIYSRLHRLLRKEHDSRASLSHALWRFRQAGEAMPDGVVVLDGDNRIEWMNPSAEGHFGLAFKTDRRQTITNLIRNPAFVGYLEAQHYGDLLVLMPVLALIIVAFFTIGEPRYRIPFDGFMILLAARCYSGGETRADGLVPPQVPAAAST